MYIPQEPSYRASRSPRTGGLDPHTAALVITVPQQRAGVPKPPSPPADDAMITADSEPAWTERDGFATIEWTKEAIVNGEAYEPGNQVAMRDTVAGVLVRKGQAKWASKPVWVGTTLATGVAVQISPHNPAARVNGKFQDAILTREKPLRVSLENALDLLERAKLANWPVDAVGIISDDEAANWNPSKVSADPRPAVGFVIDPATRRQLRG